MRRVREPAQASAASAGSPLCSFPTGVILSCIDVSTEILRLLNTNGRGSFDVSQNGVLTYFQDQGGHGASTRGQTVPQLKSNRESAASLLAFYMVVNPRQYQVGELNIVFVLHQHVTVAEDAEFGEMHHLRIATGILHLLDELLAAFK